MNYRTILRVDLAQYGRKLETQLLKTWLNAESFIDHAATITPSIILTGDDIDVRYYQTLDDQRTLAVTVVIETTIDPQPWVYFLFNQLKLNYKNTYATAFILTYQGQKLTICKTHRLLDHCEVDINNRYEKYHLINAVMNLTLPGIEEQVYPTEVFKEWFYISTKNSRHFHELKRYFKADTDKKRFVKLNAPASYRNLRHVSDMWVFGRYGIQNARYTIDVDESTRSIRFTVIGDPATTKRILTRRLMRRGFKFNTMDDLKEVYIYQHGDKWLPYYRSRFSESIHN